MLHTVYLGIGSNLGDKLLNCKSAVQLIERRIGKITDTSEFYETPAIVDGQLTNDPSFINAAVKVETTLSPKNLLELTMEIEKELGRPINRPKNAPRTIDIDILFYDDLVMETQMLQIPHPRLQKRLFVLIPLCDIASALVHPVLKVSIGELRKRNETQHA